MTTDSTPPPADDLSAAPERDVVRLARRQSEHAFREIVRRYERRVRRSIYGIVHHTERTKDLAQDTFVKAFKALDRFRSERTLAPWILRIAKNAARTYLHRRPPDSPNARTAATPESLDEAGIAAPDPDDVLTPGPDPDEVAAALRRAVQRLPPNERRCVSLRYGKGLSCEEIARILQVPPGTVSTYLHRAHRDLKRRLGRRRDDFR